VTKPQLWKYVKEFVGSYDVCAQTNNLCHHPHGFLQPMMIPESMWSSISMDFITNLSAFSSYDSILVVVDHLIKMAHFILCTKKITIKGTAKLFFHHVF
jgi:hypothetical protein